jgi:hypothetical protein
MGILKSGGNGEQKKGNVATSITSEMQLTRPTDFQDEVRIGRRNGVQGWNKFGYRTNLQAANGFETIWATSGNFVPMTSAGTFNIEYTVSQDGIAASASAGALDLTFYYVNASGEQAIALHTLSSTGTDTTSFTGYGINRIAVSRTGAAEVNQSEILIRQTSGGQLQAVIPAGQGVTQQAIFFVGDDQDAVAKFLYFNCNKLSGGSTPRTTVKGWAWNRNIQSKFEIFRHTIDSTVEETLQIIDPIGFNLSPTDVLYFEADTDTNNTEITMRFSLNLYDRS